MKPETRKQDIPVKQATQATQAKPVDLRQEKKRRKKVTEDQIKELQEAKKIEEELAQQLEKRVNILFKRNKAWIKDRRSLKQLDQPIVILLRDWKDIEVYEGIKGSTFIVPPAPEHQKRFNIGEQRTEKQYKRVVHLGPKDLYTLPYGQDTIKAYLVRENDAMPIGADSKVWSERLEFTIDAILINFEKFKTGMDLHKNKWMVDLVKWGGLVLLGYLLIKVLWPQADGNEAGVVSSGLTAAKEGLKNVTGITVIN